MSQEFIVKIGDLKKNTLWVEVCAVAESMYAILHEFPEEEKWETERKVRTSANDAMYYASQAIANGAPTGGEYDWSNARKSLCALITMYRFAGRQKMVIIDPDIMLRMEKLLRQFDNESQKAAIRTKAYNDDDINHWRKKYELMQRAHTEEKQ